MPFEFRCFKCGRNPAYGWACTRRGTIRVRIACFGADHDEKDVVEFDQRDFPWRYDHDIGQNFDGSDPLEAVITVFTGPNDGAITWVGKMAHRGIANSVPPYLGSVIPA